MGRDWYPVYGELDLGTAIERAEKAIAKIKSNKFDKKDLKALSEALVAVEVAVETYEG